MTPPPQTSARRRRTTEPVTGWWGQRLARIKSQLPRREDLESNRWLRPVAHRLAEPGLWHVRSEPIARGVAIGILWAFVIPFAQIIFAAAHCVWWRANIPTAAAITFITNPFTVGGWLYLAYQVGSMVLPAQVRAAGGAVPASGVLGWVESIGLPAVVGMGIFGIGGAVLGYVLARLGMGGWRAWRLRRARELRASGRIGA